MFFAKTPILDFLTRHLPNLSPRLRKGLFGLLALPLFGGVAAFAIAPDTDTDGMLRETVTSTITLPAATPTEIAPLDFWREERVLRGDTLAGLLSRLGVAAEEAQRVIAIARKHPALNKPQPGRTILARVSAGGQLLLLRHLGDKQRLVSIQRQGDALTAKDEIIQLETRTLMRSGVVNTSLFSAMDAADVPDHFATQLSEIFSGEIDFHRDLKEGDQFSVLYEAQFYNGQMVQTGNLLAAEYVNGQDLHQAVRFNSRYYTPTGRSLQRAFLKSPMAFSRISSGFSNARYHPVLQEWRAHRGVDYAAPTGTPIRAIADATVQFVGSKGGYGNLVELQHSGAYSTAYGHMSRFGKGIRRGARIKQGQVIGFVGQTGLATGPHLHYEFRINGVQRNPLALNLPTSVPLEARDRAAFNLASAPLSDQLRLIRGHNLSAFD
jgi:murein DD-endopeptidase MepM/ murein hydrolase activator NlpD